MGMCTKSLVSDAVCKKIYFPVHFFILYRFRFIAILASIVGASAFAPVARVARGSALKMSYESEAGVTVSRNTDKSLTKRTEMQPTNDTHKYELNHSGITP